MPYDTLTDSTTPRFTSNDFRIPLAEASTEFLAYAKARPPFPATQTDVVIEGFNTGYAAVSGISMGTVSIYGELFNICIQLRTIGIKPYVDGRPVEFHPYWMNRNQYRNGGSVWQPTFMEAELSHLGRHRQAEDERLREPGAMRKLLGEAAQELLDNEAAQESLDTTSDAMEAARNTLAKLPPSGIIPSREKLKVYMENGSKPRLLEGVPYEVRQAIVHMEDAGLDGEAIHEALRTRKIPR